MKRILSSGLFLSLFVLLPAFVSHSAEKACDMAEVKAGFYCEDDDQLLLPKDVVSGVTFYECKECEVRQAEPGVCESCGEELAKKVSEKEVCPTCWRKPVAAEICIKGCHECPDCFERTAKAGKCADCDVALVKIEVRARIAYECSVCGTYSEKPGKCEEEDCKNFGKPLAKVCSESGSFPHGS